MGMRISRFNEYMLKARMNLLEKTNTKPYFILYDNSQTEGQSKLHTKCSEQWENIFCYFDYKKIESQTQNTKKYWNICKNIEIAKNLPKADLVLII